MTYKIDTDSLVDQHLLAKIVPGVEVDGKVAWTSTSSDVDVNDIPGGVVATFRAGGVVVSTEIVPLMIDNKEDR